MGSNYSWYCDEKKLKMSESTLEPLVYALDEIYDTVDGLKNTFKSSFSDLTGLVDISIAFGNVRTSTKNVKDKYKNIVSLIDKIVLLNNEYSTGSSGNSFKTSLSAEQFKEIKKSLGSQSSGTNKSSSASKSTKNNKASISDSKTKSQKTKSGTKSKVSTKASSNTSTKNKNNKVVKTKKGTITSGKVSKASKNKVKTTKNVDKLKTSVKKKTKNKLNSGNLAVGAFGTLSGVSASSSVNKAVSNVSSSKPVMTGNSVSIQDLLKKYNITVVDQSANHSGSNSTINNGNNNTNNNAPNIKPSVDNSTSTTTNPPVTDSAVTNPPTQISATSKTQTTSSGVYKESYNRGNISKDIVSNENNTTQVAEPIKDSVNTSDTETGNVKLPEYNKNNSLFDIDDFDDDLLDSSIDEVGHPSKGISPVIPVALGAVGIGAVGVGAKVYKDRKENNELALDEDRLTNENKFWTDEEASVIHSEKEMYEEEEVVDTKYKAISNDMEDKDTWSMPEEEVVSNATVDLLESN